MRSRAYEENTGYKHVVAAHLPPPLAASKALPVLKVSVPKLLPAKYVRPMRKCVGKSFYK